MSCAIGSEVSGIVSSKTTSSANKFMTWEVEPKWKPVTLACVLMASTRGSIMRLKIVGDRGQTWRVPLVIWKGVESMLDVYTCAEGQENNASTAFII